MTTERERKLEEARAAFRELYREESGVRSLADATRSNNADLYDPNATLNAFSHGLTRSVERFGKVAEMFANKK